MLPTTPTSFFHRSLTALILLSTSTSLGQARNCKALPNTPSWPSPKEWASLNATIHGHLLAPLPPAAVCDASLSVYDNASCSYVASQWTSSAFHAAEPVSVDQSNWSGDACIPDPMTHCDLTRFPPYVANVTDGAMVKAVIEFAREKKVRVVVKGTGHDYLGRSTAPDSLSIWTHNLRGLQWHDSFVPEGCKVDGVPGITVAAGHRMFEIYGEAAKYNSTVVGGEDPDVGLGGYITGGGHSLISGQYGLAADNVLEFRVVTPKGEIKTLNPCENTNLFFAFRGGGGSSFGVILSATLKTYPMPSMAWTHFDIIQKADKASFWNATAYFHSQLPGLVKNSVMGYYNISATSPFNQSTPLVLSGAFWILNDSIAALDSVFNPVLDDISASYPVTVTHRRQLAPSLYEFWKEHFPAAPVAMSDGHLGSRLLDEKALSEPLPVLAASLQGAYPDLVLLGNLVSGLGVWHAKPPGGLGSMTPAWRKAVAHLIVPVIWTPKNDTAKAEQTSLLTNTYIPHLRSLVPDSGCYLNEADVNEPNLDHAFWGNHSARLLRIKREYDPDGVFWCAPCVGSEDWRMESGHLCRVWS